MNAMQVTSINSISATKPCQFSASGLRPKRRSLILAQPEIRPLPGDTLVPVPSPQMVGHARLSRIKRSGRPHQTWTDPAEVFRPAPSSGVSIQQKVEEFLIGLGSSAFAHLAHASQRG